MIWDGSAVSLGIPGQSAPASLKPLQLAGEALTADAHSGAVCPGLIEALMAVDLGVDPQLAFRGSLPRPH